MWHLYSWFFVASSFSQVTLLLALLVKQQVVFVEKSCLVTAQKNASETLGEEQRVFSILLESLP